jgi:Xaa-Pro dipeptidase
MMESSLIQTQLKEAQNKAELLFDTANERGFFYPGQTEKELNTKIFNLADELFGIKKFWHKRIVRAGPNTLFPYDDNPGNLIIKDDDILFLDFGPVFEDWEADLGRTYGIGNDPAKLALKEATETGFFRGKEHFRLHPDSTGAELFHFSIDVAAQLGWEFGGIIAGHIIGNFPHKEIIGSEIRHYVHPDNHEKMSDPDQFGNKRHWIYEIHYVDRSKKIGGFFEQLLTID